VRERSDWNALRNESKWRETERRRAGVRKIEEGTKVPFVSCYNQFIVFCFFFFLITFLVDACGNLSLQIGGSVFSR
jgi:hypothetical protein